MSDFFDRLEHELRGAVVRTAQAAGGLDAPRTARRRRVGGAISGLVVALGSVAAIAVAVVAIALIGHGSRGRVPLARSSAGSACMRRLLGELGVLRRPQTQADRAFDPPAPPGTRPSSPGSDTFSASNPPLGLSGSAFSQTLVPSLTRLARTLPGGHRLYFVVYQPVPGSLGAPGGPVVWLYVTGPGTSSAAPAGLVLPQLLSSRVQQQPPTESSNVYFSVVPDGVARVEWTYPRLAFPRLKLPNGHVVPRQVIDATELTANVQGNVAAAGKPVRGGLLPSATIWVAADGQVIKTFRYPVSQPPRHIPSSGTITATAKMTAVPSNC